MSEKTEIKVSCIDQVLKITDAPIVASGGLSEVRVVFSFCDKWKGFAKTATFYRDIENVYYSVLDENDTCVVPWEVCYESGTFFFGVFGEKGNTRRTSVTVRYKVKDGAITAEMTPSDPTPDVYSQIIGLMEEMNESQNAFLAKATQTVEGVHAEASQAIEGVKQASEEAHASMEKIRWNQLVGGESTDTNNGITIERHGTLIAATGTATSRAYPPIATISGLTGGHIVLLRLPKINGITNIPVYEYDEKTGSGQAGYLKNQTASNGAVLRFALQENTAKLWICPYIAKGNTVNGSDYLHLFDLTEMFGEGNEPTAEEFAVLYPKENYDYCAPMEAPSPYLSVIRSLSADVASVAKTAENNAKAIESNDAELANQHSSMEKIRWNQMVGGDATNSHNGITVAKNGTKITVTGTANAEAFPHLGTIRGLTGGHIILLRMPKLQGVRVVNLFEYDANGTPASSNYVKVHHFQTGTIQRITLQPTTEKMWVGLSVPAGTLDASGYMNCFDLSEMFGAGNEPTNEEFFRLYPAENYDYCEPTEAPAPFLSIIRGMPTGTVSNLAGKKFLIMGDSLSQANKWQKELEAKGATYTNHCLGGAGITTIVDGGSNSNGTLAPLTVDQVAGKDAIIFFGGTNNLRNTRGTVGEIYPTNETVAGYMQYAINKIYALLTEAGNLTCRVMVVTPYCFGASDYNTDAFQNDGVGLAQIIEDVANYNGIPVWNAYKNSGINPTTLAVWGAAANDKVHLNSAGYAHLGKLIAEFADRNVLD